MNSLYALRWRAPGEGRGTATAVTRLPALRDSASERQEEFTALRLRFRAPGLRIWKPGRLSPLAMRKAPSHLWPGTGPHAADC